MKVYRSFKGSTYATSRSNSLCRESFCYTRLLTANEKFERPSRRTSNLWYSCFSICSRQSCCPLLKSATHFSVFSCYAALAFLNSPSFDIASWYFLSTCYRAEGIFSMRIYASSRLRPNFVYCSSLFFFNSSTTPACCWSLICSLFDASFSSVIYFFNAWSLFCHPFLFIDRFFLVSSRADTIFCLVCTANSLCSSLS